MCRETFTIEVCQVTLIKLMSVDRNTGIRFLVTWPSYGVLNFSIWSVGTWTHAYCNALQNESQTHATCNVTLAASFCACGRTGEEGLSAHQVRMKGVNKGNVSELKHWGNSKFA